MVACPVLFIRFQRPVPGCVSEPEEWLSVGVDQMMAGRRYAEGAMTQEGVGSRQFGALELASSAVQTGILGERAAGTPCPVPAHIGREPGAPGLPAVPKCFDSPSLTIRREF